MIKLCENCKLIKECPQFNDIDIECYDDETEFEGKFEFKYTDEIIRVPKDSGFEGNEFHGSKPEREVILYNCWGGAGRRL